MQHFELKKNKGNNEFFFNEFKIKIASYLQILLGLLVLLGPKIVNFLDYKLLTNK